VPDTDTQRTRLLVQLENVLERPMFFLALIWVALLILELSRGLTPLGNRFVTGIWIIFIVDFAVKFVIAPRKLTFLRRNWATALSLLLPALRVLRFARAFRAARVLRGLRFAKLLGSMNRGILALRRTMRRRGFSYVVATTVLVILSGAAGMMAFEREGPNSAAFNSYGASVWWTAMLVTSVGSEFWPRTAAGRTLTLLLAIYGLAVLGYITATLASFFIDQDRR
jgi:voltage-gated potassium channel